MNFIKTAFLLLCLISVIVAQVPWKNCGTAADHIKIKNLNVKPYPPVGGANVTILADGSTDETIVTGTVNIDLFFEQVNLLNQTFNLCTLVNGLGITCPIPKGPLSFKITQVLPPGLPSGQYAAIVNANDPSNQELFCVSVDFTLTATSFKEVEQPKKYEMRVDPMVINYRK